MQAAYALAMDAQGVDEVPVGAVVVVDDEIVGRGYNQTITGQDPTAHAEIVALRDAAAALGNHRMPTADLYVTIEPCTMCAGALIHARIRTLYFATAEPRSGAVVSMSRVLDNTALNHRVTYEQGLCQDACAHLIKDFFAAKR